MNKGSIWRKWDFHLHTPYSILHNGYGDPNLEATWEKFVSNVEEVSKKENISAIAFTDYFMIDGYKKIKQYKEKGQLPNIFIFPNIEFRIDKIISVLKMDSKESDIRINLHVLFSPDVSENDIEENFLHDIEFIYEQETFSTADKRKLKKGNLEEFGKNLKEQHEKFRSMSDLYVGCLNAVVDPNKIKEILEKNNKFKGKYLICLADAHTSLLDWDGSSHAIRKQLLQMSHCVFSSNKKTKDFCHGKKHKNSTDFIAEFKSLKPCIWGCDSHSYDERFLVPDKNDEGKINYCWVKGDLTWDGLKQILYETEERVCLSQDNPETQKSIHTLDKLHINDTEVNDSLRIKDTLIDLNYNLISIIGGRGSGKTAFLDIMASCFNEGNKIINNPTSFYKRLYNTDKKIENNPIKIKLGTKFNINAIEKEFGRDFNIIEDTNIRYIPQNHFETYSSKPSDLEIYVFDLIFEKYPDELKKYNDKKDIIQNRYNEIETINLNIYQLINEINQIYNLEYEKKIKEGNKKDYQERIKEIEEKEKIDSKIEELSNKIEQKRNERIYIESSINRLNNIENIIDKFVEYNDLIISFNEDFVNKLNLNRIYHLDKQNIDIIASAIVKNKEILSDKLQTINTEINKINEEFRSFEDINKIVTDLRQKLIITDDEIDRLNKNIEYYNLKKEEIKKLENKRIGICKDIIYNYNLQNDYLTSIIKQFEIDKTELLKNIEFKVESRVNNIKYKNEINELIDNRYLAETDVFSELENSITGPINNFLSKSVSNLNIEQAYISIEDLLKDKLKKKTTYPILYNALFKIPIDTTINIIFDKIPLENLSMGQRAIVLLQIILAYDDKPLLIDQPEEALDNKYIYEQLVSAFRKAKKKRQIIIATHNANLVVNTDSEQIIVAEYNEGIISYSVGTIENLITQDMIKSILEGGKEAFEKREEKYGYKF